MAESSAPDEGARKPFAAFVQEQRNGGLHGELTDALAELVLAVAEHRKKGVLQLQVLVTPNSDGVTVTVADKIKLTLPEGERGAAIFFADEYGNLSRHNPRQAELPLREVGEKKADTA
jgi:hypothetical protein